jgi:hypothetical protein
MQTLGIEQQNFHVPSDAVAIRAFNLVPGVAFMDIDQPDPRIWVVERVERDSNFERVYIWARHGNMAALGSAWGDISVPNKAFDMDYCHRVCFMGITLNPGDADDTDFGL